VYPDTRFAHYIDIIKRAIKLGNITLVDETADFFIRSVGGNPFEKLYRYYLASPLPNGDDLALQYSVYDKVPMHYIEAINDHFGNAEVLTRFIGLGKTNELYIITESMDVLTDDYFMELLGKVEPKIECLTGDGFEMLNNITERYGRDYLRNRIENEIPVCDD
jgi:hypothetical protein